KVADDILSAHKDIRIVMIDLFSVSGEEEFLEAFAREVLKASSSKWQDWVKSVKDFFKQIVPKISIGSDPANDFSLSFDWVELKKNKDEILDLPEKISAAKNFRFVICLDEFQNLATYQGYEEFEKKLRSKWQKHKNVTYCLYGSKRHMLTEIFSKPSKPFYRFGDIMLLQKISREDWINFITESFKRTGKSISRENTELIPLYMIDHSWYVQQLSHYTWSKTEKAATEKEIIDSLYEVINANSPLFQKEIETISITQLNLLKAICKGETQFTSNDTMQKYRLGTPRNVSKNKAILINNDMINDEKGKIELLDPVFELWFRKQFFNEEYIRSEN
ncbi:MAG: ATP-binding protein, partial [Candidatus Delongbacteria bacterium]|nr:ATP-binding protein [Candidatus Delongbacteria bacterium]MCG2761423.1 ATP-binding protein [Candidatus Delongbacteria bacterium]